MLIVRDLHIEVGDRTLLRGASFTLHPGDKVGLVGRNGAGKTTLLRTLVGYAAPKGGSVLRSGNLGYFSQEAALPDLERPDMTALERVLTARGIGVLLRRIEEARRKVARLDGERRDHAIRNFARLQDQFDAAGGYVAEAEAKQTAAAVGIGNDELTQPVVTMSGGQRRRVELARILFAETDVMLLDEPTNHLDLDAKAWLMDYLASYRGALMVVSHDLPLLDEAITSVLSLEGAILEPYRGNYSNFLVEQERRRTQLVKERKQQERKIARLEENIRRFKGTTEKMARVSKSMETRVDRIKRDLVEIRARGKNVAVDFPQPVPSGRTPLTGSGLTKAYGDNLVFVDVDVDTNRGERLLIMGLNGAGKTTLLRILAGVEQPDLGEVTLGYRASVGYYAQEHEQIEAGVKVLDHLRNVSDQPDKVLRTMLGHFLLADKTDQDAGTLSGGEKTKLALAQLVMAQANVLLLDEPTNNLDPQAKDALLAALQRYEGTIILVSHDTGFVARLEPDRVMLMPDGDTAFFDESMLELVALA
ncbi:MAG TPA: ABC-F family ATP-binding cassette domain-containing protein [Actinobacteria bacterium]|nr:putative ABC transporter ATP-binding protein YheS [bacterium BMS3Bbin01]HDH26214.1 ABC-F family ATP-binding cassette domain-containing protein [Actinomycetota bacterium]